MKTSTTHKAEIEVLVPEGLVVYAQTRSLEIGDEDETPVRATQVWLVIEAQNDESASIAKAQIGEFVNAVMAAERS